MGLHSSNGGPFRGRSIKEIDEMMTNLRKENFNLKLRIYFLEERMGSNFNLDKENAIKKNIELKVSTQIKHIAHFFKTALNLPGYIGKLIMKF